MTSYLSEQLLSKRKEITNVDKNVDKRKLLCIVDLDIN